MCRPKEHQETLDMLDAIQDGRPLPPIPKSPNTFRVIVNTIILSAFVLVFGYLLGDKVVREPAVPALARAISIVAFLLFFTGPWWVILDWWMRKRSR